MVGYYHKWLFVRLYARSNVEQIHLGLLGVRYHLGMGIHDDEGLALLDASTHVLQRNGIYLIGCKLKRWNFSSVFYLVCK